MMNYRLVLIGLAAALTACSPSEPTVAEPAAVAPEAPEAALGTNPIDDTPEDATGVPALVPAEFPVPTLVAGDGFKVVPLGPELVAIDFAAYMSSIEHLQQTFTRSTGWPTTDISDEMALLDMQTEEQRFLNRESFAYAVLTPDGERERGCVYVRPATKPGFDAEVRLWVTKAEFDAGFDDELFQWVQSWVDANWPFQNVAYPGRQIAWDKWDLLPDL